MEARPAAALCVLAHSNREFEGGWLNYSRLLE